MTAREELEGKVAKLGTKRRFPKKAFLFLAGEPARGFFYLVSGEVRVFQMDDAGREIEIARLKPGEFFGEAVAFAGAKFPAFARAVENTETLYFEIRAVIRETGKDPELAKFFIILLAKKCLSLSARIETLSLRTVRKRLAKYLLSFCSADERSCTIELPVKKTDLAKELGTISETLSRNLRKMASQGLIEVRARKIQVKDCPGLGRELFR